VDIDTDRIHACKLAIGAILDNPSYDERPRKELLLVRLAGMFPNPDYQSKITALAAGAESVLHTVPSELSESVSGFADTLMGTLIIEFKSNLSNGAKNEDAIIKLKRYTASLWTQNGPESVFCCVASDIINWEVWEPIPTCEPSDGVYNADMVCLKRREIFNIQNNDDETAEGLILFLQRILFDETLLKIDGINLKRDFGQSSALFQRMLTNISDIVEIAQESSEVDLAIEKWKEYQTYNAIDVDFPILYIKQIYLVILSRLIVAAGIEQSRQQRIDDALITSILNGDFFVNEANIKNFVERDFFSWVTEQPWIEQLLPLSKQIFHSLRCYDFTGAADENVLRLIFEELMPSERVDIFGQRSTPENLALKIISYIFDQFDHIPKYLDPACGSGTFINSAIINIRSKLIAKQIDENDQLQTIMKSVVGIDIDPIAVIASKAIWTLSNSDLLMYSDGPIHIPIYNADSLFIPEYDREVGPDTITIQFDECSISFPSVIINNAASFDKIINWGHRKAKEIAEKAEIMRTPIVLSSPNIVERALDSIMNGMDSELVEKKNVLAISLSQFINELAKRIFEKRNGIWAFIIQNSYRPSLLAGNFDVIATNPPWLAMSHIPDVPYRNQLNEKADLLKILPGGQSFLHTDISTVFSLHTAIHFMSGDGLAAFILPRALFNGDHHHRFRIQDFKTDFPIKLLEVWDFNDVDWLCPPDEKPFKVPACLVFMKKTTVDPTVNNTIPSRFWSKIDDELDEVRQGNICLRTYDEKSAWVDEDTNIPIIKVRNHYPDRFSQGADLFPRVGLFIDITSPSISRRRVVGIRTSQIETQNPKNKILKGRTFSGHASIRYLFTTVTSNVVLPFLILEEQLPTIVLPIQCEDGEISLMTNENLIDSGDDETADWFSRISHEASYSEDELLTKINVRNKLTDQNFTNYNFTIHYGAGGSKPCAGILRMNGLEYPFIAEQTTYVLGTNNEDEAFYLIGILNSHALSRAIKPFQASGDFGPRHIHKLVTHAIPEFNNENPLHMEVVRIARTIEAEARMRVDEYMENPLKPIARRRMRMESYLSELREPLESAVMDVLEE